MCLATAKTNPELCAENSTKTTITTRLHCYPPSTTGVGNLIAIAGRRNSGSSLAGRK